MKIDIYNFKSAITAIEPELLSDDYATDTVNAETTKGSIEPIKLLESSNDVAVTSLTNSLTRISIRESVNKLVQGVDNESFVPSPLAQDDFDRVYITDNTNPPKVSAYQDIGSIEHGLGIDKPGSPTVDTSLSTGDDSRTTQVIFVEESQYGELSEPCSPTSVFTLTEEGSFTINMPVAPALGSWVDRRIYIADFAGNYRYHSTVANTVASVVVTLPFDEDALAEELDQIAEGALNTKPRAGLKGLVQMPGGFLAGYEDNVICFSKAYLPHAWPVNYEITVDGVIKAIAVAASGLVVLTDKKPFLIAGGSPDAMYPVELDISEPLYSPNAVVDMGAYVIYPSSDGLISVAGQDNRNIINGVMDNDEWRNYLSEDAVACLFNGKYWYFTNNGGFVFDVQSGSFSRHSMSAVACYGDQMNDKIYLVNPSGSLDVYSRSNALSNTFTWVSKTFTLSSQGLSCFKIDSEGATDVTVDYINNGSVITSYSVIATPYKASRLPAHRCQMLKVTVSSDAAVKRIQLASSMQELS